MTDVPPALDALAYACLLVGAFLSLTAGVGLVRFPDVLTRMHAGTKPQVLGLLLVLVGAAIRLWGSPVAWLILLTGVAQLLTAPLTAHLVSRMAYRRRHVRRDVLLVDEIESKGFGPPLREEEPQGDAPADASPDSRRAEDQQAPSGGSPRARDG